MILAVDVEVIIDKLKNLGWIRTGKITGNYQIIYCPFHNDGKETKPSCGILLKEEYRAGVSYPAGFFHCFACNASGDMNEFIRRLLEIHSLTQTVAEWLKNNIPGYESNDDFIPLIPSNIADVLKSKWIVDSIQQRQYSVQTFVSEEELASYRFTVDYMYERKLTDEIIDKYDIGYDANFVPPGRSKRLPVITFPVRDSQGRTLFFCRRSIQGKYYNYPEGVTKPVYGLYELPKNCRSVVVCESCINALTSVRYGRPAVALMGTGNPYQVQQLRRSGISEFVLCFDGDEAGKKATRRWKKNLGDIAMVWTINMPDGKDLNDLEKSEYDKLYDEKE